MSISPFVFFFLFFRFFLFLFFFFFLVFYFVSSYFVSFFISFFSFCFLLLALQVILLSEVKRLTSFHFQSDRTDLFRLALESLEELSTQDFGIAVGSDGLILVHANDDLSVFAVFEARSEAFSEFDFFAGTQCWRSRLGLSSFIDALESLGETENTVSTTISLAEGGENMIVVVFSDELGDIVGQTCLPFREFPRRLEVDLNDIQGQSCSLKICSEVFSRVIRYMVSHQDNEVDIFFSWDSDKDCAVAIFSPSFEDEFTVPLKEEFTSVQDLSRLPPMVTWFLDGEGTDNSLQVVSDILRDEQDDVTLVIRDGRVQILHCQLGPLFKMSFHFRSGEAKTISDHHS